MQSTLFFFGLLFASVAALPTSIVDIVVGSPNHTILEAQVIKNSLVTPLTSTAVNFTLFAPTDTAFTALGINGTTNVANQTLFFHVVVPAILAAGVPTTAAGTELTTLSSLPQKLRIRRYLASDNFLGTVIVNGRKVTPADLLSQNGVVHVVDGVLTQAAVNKTVAQVAAGAGLTTLLTAVGKASGGIQGALVSNGITVFAPTNAAFTAFDTLLQNAFKLTLAQALEVQPVVDAILAYHVLASNVIYSGALDQTKNLTVATALPSASLRIAYINSSWKVVGATTTATISVPDALASNGVAHVIDTVLVPDVALIAPLLPTTAPAATTPSATTPSATTPSAAGIFGASIMMTIMSLLAYFL